MSRISFDYKMLKSLRSFTFFQILNNNFKRIALIVMNYIFMNNALIIYKSYLQHTGMLILAILISPLVYQNTHVINIKSYGHFRIKISYINDY